MSAAYVRRKQRRAERCAEWTAIADRMQLVVETLTSDYYGDSILVDYAMAHRVIAYCRRVADGRREDNRSGGPFYEMITFLAMHNQSVGWVMGGDLKFVILHQRTEPARAGRRNFAWLNLSNPPRLAAG